MSDWEEARHIAKLQQRIEDLKRENAELRQILSGVKGHLVGRTFGAAEIGAVWLFYENQHSFQPLDLQPEEGKQ